MHGMLSAAVMLAAFAVIALAGGAWAVWLFRAAAATPRRSRSARLTGTPGVAAGPAPGAPGAPDATGVPEEEPDGLEAEYPERSRPGAALAASVQPAGPDEEPDGYGRSSPGPRAWPDTAKSLYSRGWPAMESSPQVRDSQQAPNGTETGAARESDVAEQEEAPPGRPEGARLYVLGVSRRPGR